MIEIEVAEGSARKVRSYNLKIRFVCSYCKREVEPDRIMIGRAHIYAKHCGTMQELGIVI